MANANEVKIEPASKATPKQITVRTIHGDMLDLMSNTWYSQKPTEVPKITPWLRSQIDAKKMEIV